MSKERTSTESSHYDQTNEDSDVFQQEDDAIRGKLSSFSDTTLQDIPIEVLQFILIKAIAMEVQNMKLAKSVWKEKADLVINRLGSVCSQWSNVFATDFFQIELHRALDAIAQDKFRIERVQELHVDCSSACGIATLKDDIFLLCCHNDESGMSSIFNIDVYDRNNIEKVKNGIELPGLHLGEIAACNVSNCVYVLKEKCDEKCASVLRITKDDDQKFNTKSWISDLRWWVESITVSDEGRVIMLSSRTNESRHGRHPAIIVYNPDGFLHQEVVLPRVLYGFDCSCGRVIRRPNGNLVLASVNYRQSERHVDLTEFDTNGIFQRQYKSSLRPMYDNIFMSFADAFGRILIQDMTRGIEVLDSELNLLESTGPQSDSGDYLYFDGLHFNRERNELMDIWSIDSNGSHLRILRLIKE